MPDAFGGEVAPRGQAGQLLQGRHVIELPAGALREIDLAPGERLLLEGAA